MNFTGYFRVMFSKNRVECEITTYGDNVYSLMLLLNAPHTLLNVQYNFNKNTTSGAQYFPDIRINHKWNIDKQFRSRLDAADAVGPLF